MPLTRCLKRSDAHHASEPQWHSVLGLVRGFVKIRFGAVQPIGYHEHTKDHEYDDEDVLDFHGFSLINGQIKGIKKQGVVAQLVYGNVHGADVSGLDSIGRDGRIIGAMDHNVSTNKTISTLYTAT